MKQYYVYITANKKNGTLYVGVTSNLAKRVQEHRNDLAEGFTKRYGVHNLVYYEECNDILETITREKCIKKWNRQWKIRLIKSFNPEWKDLYNDIIE